MVKSVNQNAAERWGKLAAELIGRIERREWGMPIRPIESVYQMAKTAAHFGGLALDARAAKRSKKGGV